MYWADVCWDCSIPQLSFWECLTKIPYERKVSLPPFKASVHHGEGVKTGRAWNICSHDIHNQKTESHKHSASYLYLYSGGPNQRVAPRKVSRLLTSSNVIEVPTERSETYPEPVKLITLTLTIPLTCAIKKAFFQNFLLDWCLYSWSSWVSIPKEVKLASLAGGGDPSAVLDPLTGHC